MGIYPRLGVKEYINAWGKATALGASLIQPKALVAMEEASTSFVEIEDLHRKAGKAIATITGAEDACVTCGASAGLCSAVAACMTSSDVVKIRSIPDTEGMQNELIMQKRHAGYYSLLTRLTGAHLVIVGTDEGTPDHVFFDAFNEKTAAVLYQANSTGPGVIPLATVLTIAHGKGVPVIVDAAAMLDYEEYIAAGADLVIYSGGKSFEGPTASGFVCGRLDLIDACHLQRLNLARPMKVGKEEIVGLVTALEIYARRNVEAEQIGWRKKVQYIRSALKGTPHVKVDLIHDTFRPAIQRVRVALDDVLGVSAGEVRERLKTGSPGVILRPSRDAFLIIDVRQLRDGDERIVAQRLKAEIEKIVVDGGRR
jgi:L-seryl-tRNA(Ser) seleniumtransferase/D-glucosaminate-6-phosphate ammonia-lyase